MADKCERICDIEILDKGVECANIINHKAK